MISTTDGMLHGYVPDTPPAEFRPVQVENATAGLCGVQLPDGRGLLTWPSGSAVHGAILDSPAAWLANNVVTAPEVFTACTPGSGLKRVACFEVDNNIYLSTLTVGATVGTIDIWQADDPAGPSAGFTLASTPHSASYSDPGLRDNMVGIPHVTPGGRWILPGCGLGPLGTISTIRTVGVWISDGPAGPWTRTLDFAFSGFGSPFDFMSGQLAPDPNGNLHIFATNGSGDSDPRNSMWRSTDDGASWPQVDTANNDASPPRWQSFARTGTSLFVSASTAVLEMTGAGTDYDHFTDTGERWTPSLADDILTRKNILTRGAMFSFAADRVARTLARQGFGVGHSRLGFRG